MKNKNLKFSIASVFFIAAFIFGMLYSCIFTKYIYNVNENIYVAANYVDVFYLIISLVSLAAGVLSLFQNKICNYVFLGLLVVFGGINIYHFIDNIIIFANLPLFYYLGYALFPFFVVFAIAFIVLANFLPQLKKIWYAPTIISAVSVMGFFVMLISYESLYGEVLISNVWGTIVTDMLITIAIGTISIGFVEHEPVYIRPQPIYDYQNFKPQQNTQNEKVDTQVVDTEPKTTSIEETMEEPVEQPRKTRAQTRAYDIAEEMQPTEEVKQTKAQTRQVELEQEPLQEEPKQTKATTRAQEIPQENPQPRYTRAQTRAQTRAYDIPEEEMQPQRTRARTRAFDINQDPMPQVGPRTQRGYQQPRPNQQVDPRTARRQQQLYEQQRAAMYQQIRGQRAAAAYARQQKPVAPKSEMEQLQQQLSKLKSMLDNGLITQEDYERLKGNILKM